ncbi:MAG: methylated-DNA--[protein]-cysteine S-methyltransferase [Pseudomonadota bacterium]
MRYTLFETAIGRCALAWSERGITRMRLPGATEAETEASVARYGARASTSEPAFVAEAITALDAYFLGTDVDLGAVPLDADGVPAFHAAVYRALREVPRGGTVTYGALAEQVGQPGAARAVGVAMGRNPWPVIVPCHRVLASGGKMGGFSAPGGTSTKERLLALEGVRVGDPVLPGLFD